MLISTIHLAADLKRMGDLAYRVAKIARLRFLESAVLPEARDVISQMGEVARLLVTKVADVVDGRDIVLANEIKAYKSANNKCDTSGMLYSNRLRPSSGIFKSLVVSNGMVSFTLFPPRYSFPSAKSALLHKRRCKIKKTLGECLDLVD